jgi:5'-phosphate synthase pdxT subunit
VFTSEHQKWGPTPISWRNPTPAIRQSLGLRIGVLALQGDFLEHQIILETLGVDTIQVRLAEDLDGLDGLILPGGESTSMERLIDAQNLRQPLSTKLSSGIPVWGTCAGLIMLAKEIHEGHPKPLGILNIKVSRNAYGRQLDSFETDLSVPVLGDVPFHAVFIRAPAIMLLGPECETLAYLEDGSPVAVREGKILVTAFHPELTYDSRFHEYFINGLEGRLTPHPNARVSRC